MALIKNIKHRPNRPIMGNYKFIETKTDVNHIRILIENGYDVKEILEDGSEIVLNFSNYDKENNVVKVEEEPVVEEEYVEEELAAKEVIEKDVIDKTEQEQPKQFKKKK